MEDDLIFWKNWNDNLKKIEDDLKKNGRRPHKKFGRRTQKKKEDDLKNKMEDDLKKNGRRPQKQMEDELK
jgi:hypothetical protein